MSDPALALQDAIETTLRASAALKTAMGLATVRLYTTTAPIGAPFPFVEIGEDQIIDDSTECLESSEIVTKVRATARVDNSVPASMRQAKAMAGVIRAELKALSGVAGFVVTLADFETTHPLKDPDGLTAHTDTFHRFLLDPAPAP